jgi:hypothetical protein
MRFLSLRAVFLLAFVIATPVLALPAVARRIDALLYGSVSSSVQPASADTLQAPPPRQPFAQSISPSAYEEQSPAASLPAADVALAVSPLAPTASFSPLTATRRSETAQPQEPQVDERTIARLQQIRERLENLGAEYVVVDCETDHGPFRFYCRMVVDDRSRFTRPFEATSADPVVAAEQVLRDVESWRLAGGASRAQQP